MPRVELISNNSALVVGGVRLTKDKPFAYVSAELAAKFCETGDAIVICESDGNGHPVDPPFSDDEVMDVTLDGEPIAADVAQASASAPTDDFVFNDVVVEDITPLTAEKVHAASTKKELLAIADEYGINLSACSNNEERRATLIASIAQ